MNPHRGNGGCRRGSKRLARLSDKLEETLPIFHPLLVFLLPYSVRLREEIRRPAAGWGDVRVVVAFVSCRVTKCRFHCVLLLFLGNDLLQGKIGIDLVRILLGTELQKERLVDALQFAMMVCWDTSWVCVAASRLAMSVCLAV